MVQNEPEILAGALRRQGIAAPGVWFVLDHAVAANSELQMSGWYLINFAFG